MSVGTQDSLRLALVTWIDAAGPPDRFKVWMHIDDIRNYVRTYEIRSVGWVVVDEPDRIVIVPNLSADDTGADATAIPREWVKSVVYLEEGKQL